LFGWKANTGRCDKSDARPLGSPSRLWRCESFPIGAEKLLLGVEALLLGSRCPGRRGTAVARIKLLGVLLSIGGNVFERAAALTDDVGAAVIEHVTVPVLPDGAVRRPGSFHPCHRKWAWLMRRGFLCASRRGRIGRAEFDVGYLCRRCHEQCFILYRSSVSVATRVDRSGCRVAVPHLPSAVGHGVWFR